MSGGRSISALPVFGVVACADEGGSVGGAHEGRLAIAQLPRNSGSCPARAVRQAAHQARAWEWGLHRAERAGGIAGVRAVTNADASFAHGDASSIRLWLRSDKNLVLILCGTEIHGLRYASM